VWPIDAAPQHGHQLEFIQNPVTNGENSISNGENSTSNGERVKEEQLQETIVS